MNEYAIEMIKEKQSFYKLIYAISPVEQEILQAYIKTLLKTGFTGFSNLLQVPISFLTKNLTLAFTCVWIIKV